MEIIKKPENGHNFVAYEVSEKTIDFEDGELTFRVDKRERDDEVVIDICRDYMGGLVMGCSDGDTYVAQIAIPAREYEETEKVNSNYTEGGTEQPIIVERKPVPFSMDKCTLTLWEMEV